MNDYPPFNPHSEEYTGDYSDELIQCFEDFSDPEIEAEMKYYASQGEVRIECDCGKYFFEFDLIYHIEADRSLCRNCWINRTKSDLKRARKENLKVCQIRNCNKLQSKSEFISRTGLQLSTCRSCRKKDASRKGRNKI